MTGDDTSKFVTWWRANPRKAEAILERRRQKRQTEKGREKERARKAAWRAKQREKPKRFPRPKFFHHGDRIVELWSVGRTCEFLEMPSSTWSWLEREKKIPINRFIDEHKRRWWPEPFIRWLKPLLDARRKREISPSEFHARVFEGWTKEKEAGTFPDMNEVNHG